MRVILSIFFIIFFVGCSNLSFLENKIINSKSAIILLKTNQLKFNDTGFINYKEKEIEIRAMSAGVEVLRLDINTHICLNSICYQKEIFNRDFLNKNYPIDILKNIFLHKEIYSGKNRQSFDNGFIQEIKTEFVNIFYKVEKNSVYFKDSKNKILIKIVYQSQS